MDLTASPCYTTNTDRHDYTRERERDRQRQRDRDRDRDRQRQTDRDRHREAETQRESLLRKTTTTYILEIRLPNRTDLIAVWLSRTDTTQPRILSVPNDLFGGF